MSLVTEEIKASASEMYHGDEICQVKSKFLLEEVGMPRGLLPLRDIEECGYVKETGFVWLKQKKSITHKFDKIGAARFLRDRGHRRGGEKQDQKAHWGEYQGASGLDNAQ
ncbi:putative Aproteint domain-containing protein [Hibiscus syriacus]|uniref:Aproteint domain-containing protein n=1 Tax=Hibiscus syriacus TaxID=106335 RepID=A0A6A2YF56_HIBSY|nr:putative Aproteint domain-containing protein [Hibiscus syriacus]